MKQSCTLDGIHYTIQNYVNKKYFGRFADAADDSPGGGLGYVDDRDKLQSYPLR